MTIDDVLNEYSKFVPKFYRMNPETDELLPNGRYLADGMVVLIETSTQRMRVDNLDNLKDWEMERALTANRWCTVSNLEIGSGGEIHTPVVKFTAIYEDGMKRDRTYALPYSWLVKIDSLGNSMAMVAGKYDSVLEQVNIGLKRYRDYGDVEGGATRDEIAQETTRRILGLL